MLHKGMAVIIRNEDEFEVFAQAIERQGWRYVDGTPVRSIKRWPLRISFNVESYNKDNRPNHCLTMSDNLKLRVNAGITEVVEASRLFRNQLIAERRKQNAT